MGDLQRVVYSSSLSMQQKTQMHSVEWQLDVFDAGSRKMSKPRKMQNKQTGAEANSSVMPKDIYLEL